MKTYLVEVKVLKKLEKETFQCYVPTYMAESTSAIIASATWESFHVHLIAFLKFVWPFLKIICRVSVEMIIFDIAPQSCIQREHFGAIEIAREPVWSWLRDHCASLTTMSADAVFSHIFRTNTTGVLTDDIKSLLLIQQRNQSFCSLCSNQIVTNTNIFVLYITCQI